MTLDELVVIVASIFGIGFTYWFFLMKKEEEVAVVGDAIDVVVDGGYNPDVIVIPNGKTTKINFIRRDPSTCLEEVVLGDFKIKKYLPINEKTTVEITPQKKGEFKFTCGMNMFHGKLRVV